MAFEAEVPNLSSLGMSSNCSIVELLLVVAPAAVAAAAVAATLSLPLT